MSGNRTITDPTDPRATPSSDRFNPFRESPSPKSDVAVMSEAANVAQESVDALLRASESQPRHRNGGPSLNARRDSYEGNTYSNDEAIVQPSPPPNARKAFASTVVLMACFMFSYISCVPVNTQYLNWRIARDSYNFSLTPGAQSASPGCMNTSGHHGGGGGGRPDHHVMNLIQRDASRVMVMMNLVAGVPATLACLVVGSYSDFIGRRPLAIAATVGGVARTLSLAAVVYFNLAIPFLYVGCFLEGLLGSLFVLFLATNAIIADITPVVADRASKFAVLEGVVLVCGALSMVAVGFMIKEWGYFAPSAMTVVLSILALIIATLVLPETNKRNKREEFTWNPKGHMRKVFGFYFLKSYGKKRVLYGLALCVFLLFDLTQGGRNSVEMLFELNTPICWSSVSIGVYSALRMIVWSTVAVIVLRFTRYRVPLEATGIICGLSAVAGFVVESLATTGFMMYISAIAGILFAAMFPIPRALVSQITSPAEQGALFSGLAFVQAGASMFASLVCTILYNATIATFKGAVFLFMGALCALATILLAFYWYWRQRHPPPPISEDGVITKPLTHDFDGNSSSQERVVSQTEEEINDRKPLLS